MSDGAFEKFVSLSHEVPRSGKSHKHIKRPMNAFMVWAHERRKKMSVVSPTMHHSNISKILGAEWKMLSEEEKMPFVEKAKQIHEQHMTDNPDYKYRPQRKVRNNIILKRPRTTQPAVLPTAPPTTVRAFPVNLSSADNEPFEIPIIGVTSVRQYTMEEYNYRQNSLPHLSQKASDFVNLSPVIPPVRRAVTVARPSAFSLKPEPRIPPVATCKSLPISTSKPKVPASGSVNPGTKSQAEYTTILLAKPNSSSLALSKSPLPPPLPETLPAVIVKEEARKGTSPARDGTAVPSPKAISMMLRTPLLSSLRKSQPGVTVKVEQIGD